MWVYKWSPDSSFLLRKKAPRAEPRYASRLRSDYSLAGQASSCQCQFLALINWIKDDSCSYENRYYLKGREYCFLINLWTVSLFRGSICCQIKGTRLRRRNNVKDGHCVRGFIQSKKAYIALCPCSVFCRSLAYYDYITARKAAVVVLLPRRHAANTYVL